MKKNLFWNWVLGMLVLVSCSKKEIGPQSVENVTCQVNVDSRKLIMGNEGNFGSGNASVSLYDIEQGSSCSSYYSTVNGGSIGDVLQSIAHIEDSYYLIVNNSEKIIKLDTESFQSTDVLVLQNRSPRYMVDDGNGQSFVSNFAYLPGGSPVYIDVIDNVSFTVIDSINIGLWTEEMMVIEDRLFACVTGGSQLVVIDVVSHEVIDYLDVGREPLSIVEDASGMLWVLCSGGISQEEIPSLWKIDPATLAMESMVFSDLASYPTHLVVNGAGDKLYFLDNGVYEMQIDDSILPVNAIVEDQGIDYYSLGVDPVTNEIYVADANGFAGFGQVYRFAQNGEQLDVMPMGIGPSSFLFQE